MHLRLRMQTPPKVLPLHSPPESREYSPVLIAGITSVSICEGSFLQTRCLSPSAVSVGSFVTTHSPQSWPGIPVPSAFSCVSKASFLNWASYFRRKRFISRRIPITKSALCAFIMLYVSFRYACLRFFIDMNHSMIRTPKVFYADFRARLCHSRFPFLICLPFFRKENRYQYALHTNSFEEQPVSKRTLSRFRSRLAAYELMTGEDLLQLPEKRTSAPIGLKLFCAINFQDNRLRPIEVCRVEEKLKHI